MQLFKKAFDYWVKHFVSDFWKIQFWEKVFKWVNNPIVLLMINVKKRQFLYKVSFKVGPKCESIPHQMVFNKWVKSQKLFSLFSPIWNDYTLIFMFLMAYLEQQMLGHNLHYYSTYNHQCRFLPINTFLKYPVKNTNT